MKRGRTHAHADVQKGRPERHTAIDVTHARVPDRSWRLSQHDVEMHAEPRRSRRHAGMHIGERGACGAICCLAFEIYIDAVHLSLI